MRKIGLIALLFSLCLPSYAMPDIRIEHGKSLDGFARARIINNTTEILACYVAIDGYKKKFVLGPLKPSTWYKATDKRFNYKHFSTWCDYLEFYPHYAKYQ
ncbi:hypothetical protein LP316_03250 [Thalassotalea sp. LPB0316]|uniref:hypothetical protein n=1 Tax=Thalassotalea sp. LPB0316 TaxID=2769490 RepID=UPI0018660503|nr:hypothetical protein [Thalassotalea sp. LPB0316]QOL26336.1 hypothetical protein LP316_03250 [Thalassotalea sp. LPB0316]